MGKEPAMNFYVTGGTLQRDARSYVERLADAELHHALLHGEFCYVLTSRQMGKSSLMVRAAGRLRKAGARVVAVDLTAVGGHEVSAEQWYYGILDMLGEHLRLESELETCWRTNLELGPLQRLMKGIRQVAIPRLEQDLTRPDGPCLPPGELPAADRLVIFIDEIDVVRSLPFSTDDFFAAIRECYNRRTQDPVFERITFCLLGVASPSDLIRDPHMTPFNIGHRVELHDFSASEAAPLAKGLEEEGFHSALAQACLHRVLHWSGGHPYLTQQLCRQAVQALRRSGIDHRGTGFVTRQKARRTIDHVCHELFLDSHARERDDNLIFVRERLLRSGADLPGLLDLYLQVRRRRHVPDDKLDPLVTQLRLSGIVRRRQGRLQKRNRIYWTVFNSEWVRAHMPQAELRRQREAWWRGVFWATALSALVLAAGGMLGFMAWENRREATRASVQAQLAHARELRLSGTVGHRASSLQAIRAASAFHRDKSVLVSEAIASLALPDLEPDPGPVAAIHPVGPTALPPAFDYEAVPEQDGTLNLRRFPSGATQVMLEGLGSPAVRMELAMDGRHAVVEYAGTNGPFLGIWNTTTGQLLARVPQGIVGRAIDFSPDGHRLALGRWDGTLQLYTLGETEAQVSQHLRLSESLDPLNVRIPQVVRFHPQYGTSPEWEILLESSAGSSVIQVWRVRTDEKRRLFFRGAVRDFCWHPSGRLLAAACDDDTIQVIEFGGHASAEPGGITLIGHEAAVNAIAFNHRGDLLASIGADATLRLWTLASDRMLALPIEADRWDQLWFSQDDNQIIAAAVSNDTWRRWRVRADEFRVLSRHTLVVSRIRNPAWNIDTLDFSPDGRLLAAASSASITLWDLNSGRRVGDLALQAARGVAFGAESNDLWVSSDSGLAHHPLGLRADSPPPLHWPTPRFLPTIPEELGIMTLTRDRRRAAVAHRNQVLMVDLEEASFQVIPTGMHFQQIALSSGGEWMAGRERDRDELSLWHSDSATAVATSAPLWSGDSFGFTPDNRWLIAFCDRGPAWRFYRVESWELDFEIEVRNPGSLQPGPFAVSDDSRFLALVSARSSIRLYDLGADPQQRAASIATLESPEPRRLLRLLFSPDGAYLAAVTHDQSVQLWDLSALRAGLQTLGLGSGFAGHTRPNPSP
jgi:WD40 repeat protein